MFDSKIVIYTDGACSGNPGPGGWGALLKYNNYSKEIFGYDICTTNNRMELEAAIQALMILKKRCEIVLYTDSKYLQLGITKWMKSWVENNWNNSNNKPVKNKDLWQKLYTEVLKHSISWNWVKGHGINFGNQIADKLAIKGKECAIRKL